MATGGGCPETVQGGPGAGVRTEFGRFSTRLHPYLGDACKANEDTTVRTVTPTPLSRATALRPTASLPATPSCASVAFSIPSHHCPQAGPQAGWDKARTCPGEDARNSHSRHQAGHATNTGHHTWHPSNPGTCGERGEAAWITLCSCGMMCPAWGAHPQQPLDQSVPHQGWRGDVPWV